MHFIASLAAVALTSPNVAIPRYDPAIQVCACGDADGDGAWDLAIGLAYDSAHGTEAGRVFIVSTKDGHTIHELSTGTEKSHFGFALAGGAGLGGDASTKLLVTSIPDDPLKEPMSVSVWSVKEGKQLHTFVGRTDTGRRIDGFGNPIAIVGDVNRDGHAEFAISGHVELVHVYSGDDGRELIAFNPDLESHVYIGDVNGDSVRDIAFMTFVEPPQAKISVRSPVDGREIWTTKIDKTKFTPSRVFDAGDLDDDGRSEVGVLGQGPQGFALIYSGKDGSFVRALRDEPVRQAAGARKFASEPTRRTIRPIQAADGVRAHGFLVGIPDIRRPRPEFAQTQVIPPDTYFANEFAIGGVCVLDAAGDAIRTVMGPPSETTDQSWGEDVVALGDVDADGWPDFAMAATYVPAGLTYETWNGGVCVCSGRTGAVLFSWLSVADGQPIVRATKPAPK